jgi:hypothetical protein
VWSLTSHCVSVQFNVGCPVWSCAFDATDPNRILCGDAHGRVKVGPRGRLSLCGKIAGLGSSKVLHDECGWWVAVRRAAQASIVQ